MNIKLKIFFIFFIMLRERKESGLIKNILINRNLYKFFYFFLRVNKRFILFLLIVEVYILCFILKIMMDLL